MNFKVSVIKKNQILASMVVLMLIVAGYLNYTYDPTKDYETEITGVMSNNLGDAYLVDSSSISTNMDDIVDSVEASTKVTTAEEYFANSRMERDNSFAEQLENYEKILSNDDIKNEEKSFAQAEISRINNTKNAIVIAENLIKLKGFKDVIILVNDDSVNVVVMAEKLSDNEVAQIQNIVINELKVNLDNLHISTIQGVEI